MANFSQKSLPFQIETPLGQDAFYILSFEGTETLSGLFEFTLQVGAPIGTTVDFAQLMGKEAGVTLTYKQTVQRRIQGIIAEFASTHSDASFDYYEMVLRPRLWLLSLNKQSRIFQQQSATQILGEVLNSVQGALIEVLPQPTARNYCTQYRETDLAFFQRLCFEEGITHYWEHTSTNHQLILTNNTTTNPSVGICEFNQTEGGSQDLQSIKSWKTKQVLVNPQVGIRDSHFELFNQSLTGSGSSPSQVMAGTLNLSVNSSPGPWQENQVSPSRYFDEVNASGTKDPSILSNVYDVIQTRAQNMSTAASCRVITAEGSSTCMNLVPGFQFVLEKHPTADGSWLVLELTHKARQQGAFWNGEQANIQYENRFKAAPSSVNQKPWPPIARPVVGSVETAIVTGQTNQESNLDPYGRVQVRFWWDDPEASGHTSCWIRVAQFWAGQGYGAFFWPRVGHEVVVAFEHGDPDRPIVVGSVYNSTNTMPYSMPGNTYISGFRTKTQGGSAAENCHKFTLSDVPGSEIINIHAESMLITNQEKQQFSLRTRSNINVQ